MSRLTSREALPSLNDEIDVLPIDLHSAADSASLFRSYDSRSASQKGIKDNAPSFGAIFERVRHKSDGFNGGMISQQVAFIA